jgi:hypothetical protein
MQGSAKSPFSAEFLGFFNVARDLKSPVFGRFRCRLMRRDRLEGGLYGAIFGTSPEFSAP